MNHKTKKLLAISLLLTIVVIFVFTLWETSTSPPFKLHRPENSLEDFTVTRLTTDSADERDPMWNNDGNKIFFRQDDYICVVNSDGSNLKKLAEGRNLALSPDGTKIYYIQTKKESYIAWIMNSDGSKKEKIAELTFIPSPYVSPDNPHPFLYSWSPDRTKIIYFIVEITWPYWIWDLEKNETKELTSFEPFELGQLIDGEVVWNPDGKKIALPNPKVNEGSFSEHIWVIDVESGEKEKLTSFIGVNAWPLWSPNGKKIMYLQSEAERHTPINFDIWVMDSDGGNKTQLTDSTMHEEGEWSPDGKRIAYISTDSDCQGTFGVRKSDKAKSEIWVMNADGTDKKQLLSIPCNNGLIMGIEWSPSESKIAFVWAPNIKDIERDIYVIDVSAIDEIEKD